MLSIAKLRVGQEAYQLSGVAQSLDAYYTGAGEANGEWVGGGAARLALDGEVDGDDLRAVLAGMRPGVGGLTPNGDRIRPHPRRVPGFDLTFKAPKSASVLYAVSDDPRVQGAVIEAGEAAMRAAVGWLEREAIQVQRGSHNQAYLARLDPGERALAGPRRLPTSGVVAAAFRHRTSRAGDPLLHWHVLVANLVEGTDGRWSAFAHPDLYRHARAAGELFQTVFRDELSRTLGVEWRPGRHVPEIAGIPQALIDQFSKRSAEIEAWLAATGTSDTPEGRQQAVLATRRHKPEVENDRFDAAWKLEAEAAGWGPAHADGLIAATTDRAGVDFDGVWRIETVGFDEHGRPEQYERVVEPEEWIGHVITDDLTNDRSTFTRPDIARAVAARLSHGASIETVERVVARFVASPQLIDVHTVDGGQVWTSRQLVDIERRFIDTLAVRHPAPPVAAAVIDGVLADHRGLGGDQRAAVETVTASAAAVSVLIGPAGTGKTYTLDAIRAIHQHAGIAVVGAAPSARAALELADGAQLPTRTLHSLLNQWHRGYDTPARATLLVIDEAGMADIRTLEAVVTRQVAAGGRVLLVGDHHQLPEVGAGGGFAHAATHARCVAELTVNRRQRQPWEQQALTELRNGSVARAVAAYLAHDRVVAADTPVTMIDLAVDRWFAAVDAGLRPVLLAGTNNLVDALNRAVIDRLVATGELDHTEQTQFGGGVYRPGERLVLRRNTTETTTGGDQRDLANGQAGTVLAVTDTQLTIRLDDHPDPIVLTDRYLRRGGQLTHAYALTTHRAQGGTWNLSIAVGADGLYREAAYVELSRGTHENWIILTEPEAAELHRQATAELERHDTGLTPPDQQPDTLDDDLTRRLTRSAAKHLAHTIDADLTAIDHLVHTLTLTELETGRHDALTAERHATDTCGYDGDQIRQELDRLTNVATHIAVGQNVSPHDRHNIGTVTALNDHTGTVDVQFISADGHEADKTFPWSQLRIVQPVDPELRELPPAATRRIADLTDELHTKIDRWEQLLRTEGVEPGDADRHRHAATRVVDQHAAALTADQPSWLIQLIGERPTDVAGARTWDDTCRQIAHWCAAHSLDSSTPGLGPRPERPDTGWEQLNARIGLTRVWLAESDRGEPAWPIVPSNHELSDRLVELDGILDAAPPDWREIIHQLRHGQLSLDDTAELLQTALDGQQARHAWIIEHWPHVVECQEINRTLTTGTWGPDPELLTDLLEQPISTELATAIQHQHPWVRAALCAFAVADADSIDGHAITWLEDVAAYRTRHGLTCTSPLGDTELATESTERDSLLDSLGSRTEQGLCNPLAAQDVEVRSPSSDLDLGI